MNSGDVWRINVQRHFNVSEGSDLTIPCTFTYPSQYHTEDVEVYWKKKGQSVCSKSDLDRGAFVFHPNDTCVLPNYRGRTKLIGDKTKGNCSLQITNIIISEPYLYMRVSGKGKNYSFKKENVKISVNGENLTKTYHYLNDMYMIERRNFNSVLLISSLTGRYPSSHL